MQRNSDRQAVCAKRMQARWRVRACSVGLCIGVQVFLVGAGAATPLCLNAAWIAGLCALPASALSVLCCRRILARRAARRAEESRLMRAASVLLAAAFMVDAVFAAASLISLAEQSLLPQTKMLHSMLMTLAAAIACALSGQGIWNLSFALRFALPACVAGLCALSLPRGQLSGLFPLLGPGAGTLLPGCVCMAAAAFPALLLLAPWDEEMDESDESMQMYLPEAGFLIRRALAGAAAGEALLVVLALGGTYTAAGSSIWGRRLLLAGAGRQHAGIAGMALTVLEAAAMLLLCAHMLQGAERMLCGAFKGLNRYKAGLFCCAAVFLLLLGALLFSGIRLALAAVPLLSIFPLLVIAAGLWPGGKHGT